MAGLLGLKLRYWAAAGAVATVGHLYPQDDGVGFDPVKVDATTAYCEVHQNKEGRLTKAFIRRADTNQAIVRFEPSADLEDAVANKLSGGTEIRGLAISTGTGERQGTMQFDRANCVVNNDLDDAQKFQVLSVKSAARVAAL